MSINSRIVPSVQSTPMQQKGPMTRYVNIAIQNPNGNVNQMAEYDATMNGDILPKGEDYMVAVPSFSLPLQNLPLFIFPIEPNQATATKSTLQIGVCKNMTQAQVNAGTTQTLSDLGGNLVPLTWVPQTMGISLPVQNESKQVISPAHYCYSFEHFANLVNTAVSAAWTAASTPGGAGKAPVFAYSEVSHTFAWQLDDAFVDAVTGTATDGWTVCWNTEFDNLLNNFNTIESTQGLFLLENQLSRLTNTAGTTVFLPQDYPTTDYFNSVERIVCVTDSIPIVQDYMPANTSQPQGISAKQSILCDVSLDFDNDPGAQRSTLVYNPPQWLWSDIKSPLPLRTINLRFLWLDSRNNAYPIYVSKTDTITVKLAFYHKSMLIR